MTTTTTTDRPVFTVERQTLPGGDWIVAVDHIVAAAVKAAKLPKRSERDYSKRFLPRFLLKADEESHGCEREKDLRDLLASVRPGAKCTVFRNAGKGATIDFEI